MRLTTYLGLIGGVLVIALVVVAKGGDHTLFTNYTALAVCLGGTVAAITLSSAHSTWTLAFDAMARLFFRRTLTSRAVAAELVKVARQAKTKGLASLGPESLAIKDPFLSMGLQLVADGVEAERIESLLELESDILSDNRRMAERAFKMMGTYSPMFGLIGTLIGLISMLKDLTDPRAIGHGMAVALMATFYGVLLAGLLFLPIAAKIRTLEMDERRVRDQITAALLAVRLGENPEVVREMLDVFAQNRSSS